VLQPEGATTPLRQLYFIAQMILINPEGKEHSTAMFRKSITMLLTCFKNEEILAELKRIDALVSTGRAFDALKAIRGLYAIEDGILNNHELPPTMVEQIRREIAPWR
jgi:flagellar protein FlbT